MRHFKQVADGYILGIGMGGSGEEITEVEYNEIMTAIQSRPQETETVGYHLKADLTWESYEKEPLEDELEASEAIEILLGGAS